MKRFSLCLAASMLASSLATFSALAQNAATTAAQDAAPATNPLANITAFNIQNYYIDEFTGIPSESGNKFVLRYAQPVSFGSANWLIRASLPYNSFPFGQGGSTVEGDGDFNFFVEPQYSLAHSRVGNPKWQVFLALNMQFLK